MKNIPTVSKTELALETGKSAQLTALTITDDGFAQTAEWTSSKESVATVDNTGKVTAVSKGTAKITAAYNGQSTDCIITVVDAEVGKSGACGENMTWELSDSGKLTISGAGAMDDYPYYESEFKKAPWYDSDIALQSVEIGSGITHISLGAFSLGGTLKSISVDAENRYYCSDNGVLFDKDKTHLIQYPANASADRYEIPDSINFIDAFAFRGAVNLKTVAIPNEVETIGDAAFCDAAIESVTLPDCVSSIGMSAFESCESLTAVQLGSSISAIGEAAFYRCDALETITFLGGVPTIGQDAFTGVEAVACYPSSWSNAPASDAYGGNLIWMSETDEIALNQSALTLTVGDSATLKAIVNAEDKTVTWESSDAAIAAVDNDGKITAKKVGSVGITATTKTGKTAVCTVTVQDKPICEKHTYGEWQTVENTDTHKHVCSVCGYEEVQSHNWGEGEITTEAICTQKGVRTYTCAECHATKTEEIPMKAHTVVIDAAIDATCTAAGKTEGTHCSVCGSVITAQEVAPALGHKLTAHEARAAACTETGSTAYWSCDACDEYFSDAAGKTAIEKDSWITKALGHDFSKKWTTDKAATCTEAGSKSHHCSRCDAENDVTEIEALGHKGELVGIKSVSCTEEGYTGDIVCTVCKQTLKTGIKINKLSHTASAELSGKEDAACTETGYTGDVVCKDCGTIITKGEVIPALGHSFTKYVSNNDAAATQDGTKTAKCDRCDATDTITDIGSATGIKPEVVETVDTVATVGDATKVHAAVTEA